MADRTIDRPKTPAFGSMPLKDVDAVIKILIELSERSTLMNIFMKTLILALTERGVAFTIKDNAITINGKKCAMKECNPEFLLDAIPDCVYSLQFLNNILYMLRNNSEKTEKTYGIKVHSKRLDDKTPMLWWVEVLNKKPTVPTAIASAKNTQTKTPVSTPPTQTPASAPAPAQTTGVEFIKNLPPVQDTKTDLGNIDARLSSIGALLYVDLVNFPERTPFGANIHVFVPKSSECTNPHIVSYPVTDPAIGIIPKITLDLFTRKYDKIIILSNNNNLKEYVEHFKIFYKNLFIISSYDNLFKLVSSF
jgi:hypothetical protein